MAYRKAEQLFKSLLRSYGVLAFAAHPIPATLILGATFFHPVVGLMGVAGCAIATLTARWLHASKEVLAAGVYGVSGILIGLALGMYAPWHWQTGVFLLIGAAMAGILSVVFGRILSKYDLPLLSIPFMVVIWLILLVLGMQHQNGIDLPAWPWLRKLDLQLFDFLPLEIFQAIKMFGNILFQENLFSGVLVFTALLLYSRISALYALYGGLVGMATYAFLHGSVEGYHGLNSVLTALAFGGFFVVHNRHTFLLTTLAVILVGLVDQATAEMMQRWASPGHPALPTLVFAFNMVTILLLIPLKTIPDFLPQKRLTVVPLYLIRSPEANLRWFKRYQEQRSKTVLTLPFVGEWVVLQGNDGEWTHKGPWRFAWDFIVRDAAGNQTHGFGLRLEDYYAFGLPVLAPAPGRVVAVEASLPDNPPRQAEIEHGWGNYVILDHGNGEYSELSHFRQGGITVQIGQAVKRGEIIGYCGNSGRSPVPHIHFQLQRGAYPGAPSLPAVFFESKVNGSIKLGYNPRKDERVAAVVLDSAVTWSLFGRENEQLTYEIQSRWWKQRETLVFTTDEWGQPLIVCGTDFAWFLIGSPNFIAIRPDYKTYPQFLRRCTWLDLVGEELVLPRKLIQGLRWEGGQVERSAAGWLITTSGKQLLVDPEQGIVEIRKLDDPQFKYRLVERRTLKQ